MNGTCVGYPSNERTTMQTFARMTAAELLKLYRRRALMAWSVTLFVGGQIAFYGLGAIQHAAGRSRIALFAVRVPAALAVAGVLAAASFAITAVGALLFAGAEPAPSAAALAQCGLAVAVTIGVTTVLAVGLSSLLSSRSITIGLLLCWTLAVARMMEHATGLGSLRELLSVAAEDRLIPVSVGGAYVVPISVWTAALVLLVWAAAALLAGAWQTARRDA